MNNGALLPATAFHEIHGWDDAGIQFMMVD